MKRLKQNARSPMIRGAVIGPIMRAVDAAGVDWDALFAGYGMSRRSLADPYEIVSLQRYAAVFERAAEALGQAHLGLQLGTELHPSELGPAGLMFMSSPTLQAAIHKFSIALESWQSSTTIDLIDNEGWPVWTYHVADPAIRPRRQDSEYSISAMCHMIRTVLGTEWKPVEVHLEHSAPPDLRPYRHIFRAPVRFEQAVNGVVLRTNDLSATLSRADVQMVRMMERHATDLIARAAIPQDLAGQVRDLVRRRLAREPLTVANVAKDFALSSRSLQRHLAGEGTSVRQIIREERQRAVDMLLRDGPLGNATLARAVGYADATVLWRARQNWRRSG